MNASFTSRRGFLTRLTAATGVTFAASLGQARAGHLHRDGPAQVGITNPADLSHATAVEIVRARVDEVLRPWRDAEVKAAQEKKAKEEADRRRMALIAYGNNYASRETTGWDWSASTEARDEVKKVLEREVEHAWTEREVEDEVDEILARWDDEEGDEAEWDDEDD